MLTLIPSPAPRPYKGEGSNAACAALPVTCGELVQGTLDGVPCLISCPIDRYHVARVSIIQGQGVRLLTLGRDKTRAVIAAAVQAWQLDGCVRVSVEGDTPVGRGYGSSTADMGAALYALAQAAQVTPDPL